MYQDLSNGWVLLRLLTDILCVWALLYFGLRLIKNNQRTIQIVKGLLFILLIKYLANLFNLIALSTLLDTFLNWGVILVLIVLQPEIRAILERMGKSSPVFSSPLNEQETRHMIDEVVAACQQMSEEKTGALISIEMGQSLQDYIRNGTGINSDVSKELIEQLFVYGTPTHDGAIIIEGNKIKSAASYLPNTNQDLPLKYGARHRAALGLSEITDSITIIVSEETGNITIANNGQLIPVKPEALQRYLQNRILPKRPEAPESLVTKTISGVSSMFTGSGQKAKVNDQRVKPIEVVDLREEEVKEVKK